jgi:hypothetical protein
MARFPIMEDGWFARLTPLIRANAESMEPGLSAEELSEIEDRFGFAFGPDHRTFLESCVPVGKSWVDWRHGSFEDIDGRLKWPVDGILFHVESGDFWPPGWGVRPSALAEALRTAADRMQDAPTLVPIFSHRYAPAAPSEPGAPVFSVYSSDVIYYGSDLLDYLRREFAGRLERQGIPKYVRFWSELAEGREDDL